MEGFWTSQVTFDTLSYIVSLESTDDVATAIRVLVHGNSQFSSKGGGHVPFANAGSITGGVQHGVETRDVATFSEDKKIASMSLCVHWSTV